MLSSITRSISPNRISPKTSEWIWNILVIGIPFVLYIRTMAPTVYGLDSAELTTGAYTLGIVHPPGSPLFLILGKLFTLIPIGDIGYRVNLLSVVAAVLTIFTLYRLIYKLTNQQIIAFSTSLFFAFTYYFWISALAAELYSLETFFVVLSIYLAVNWRQKGKSQELYVLALIFGLGLGNHSSLILLSPGLAWIVFHNTREKIKIRQILICSGLFIVGLSIYLYLPIRYVSGAPLNYARDYLDINLTSIQGFWWMVTGKAFSSLFWAYRIHELPGQIREYVFMLWSNFFGLGCVLGVIGFIGDYKYRISFHLGLAIMWLGYLLFYIPYGALDKEVMFLPTYIIWAIWIGLGILHLKQLIIRRLSPSIRSIAPNILVFLAISILFFNFRFVDLSKDWSARDVGQSIMKNIEPNSYFFGSWVDVPILEYLQFVEGSRPDVVIRNMVFIPRAESQKLVLNLLKAEIPVFVSRTNWFVGSDFIHTPVADCECFRLDLRKNHQTRISGGIYE